MAAHPENARTAPATSVAGVVGFALALAGFAYGSRPLFDNSAFTHLATGRLILESGVPRADVYSFTAAGEPWVVQSWLPSVLYALAERIGGGGAVRALSGLVVGVLVLLAWRLTRPAGALVVRVAVVAVFLLATAPFLSPRPLTIGLVLLAATLVIVAEGRDPRWLVPVFWLWVNSHGSFPLGLAALAAIAAGEWLDGDRDRARLHPLAWAAVGTVAGAISPGGPALLLFPVHLLGRMEVLENVVEWRSPSFATDYARLFLVLVVVAVIALVRRPRYAAALPVALFTALALIGVRNLPVASLVLVAASAGALEVRSGVRGRERGVAATAVAVALAVAVAAVVVLPLRTEPPYDLSSYPTAALAVLDDRGLLGRGARIAHPDDVGNLLELLEGRDAHVFFDDRYDVFPTDVAGDHLVLAQGRPGWEAALDRHDVDVLLWSRPGPLAALVGASPRWRLVYQDERSFIACRRDAATPEC